MKKILVEIVLFSAMVVTAAQAEVGLSKLFSDNMMIQRDQPVRVWGVAAPGEDVKVSLSGNQAVVKTDTNGRWQVELPLSQART